MVVLRRYVQRFNLVNACKEYSTLKPRGFPRKSSENGSMLEDIWFVGFRCTGRRGRGKGGGGGRRGWLWWWLRYLGVCEAHRPTTISAPTVLRTRCINIWLRPFFLFFTFLSSEAPKWVSIHWGSKTLYPFIVPVE